MRWMWAGLLFCALFVLVWLYKFSFLMSPNAALFLQATEMMLARKRLYIDALLISPPLLLYLNVIPVLIGKFLAINYLHVFHVIVLLMTAGACWVFEVIRRRATIYRVPFSCTMGLAGFAIYAALIGYFGEREYLFMIAFIPYFFLRWVEVNEGIGERKLRLSVVFICSLLATIKPHFFALIFVYEGYLFVAKRDRTLPYVSLLLPPFLYLLHFVFLPSDINRAFWFECVPMVARKYHTYGLSWRGLFRARAFFFLQGLFFLVFAWVGWLSQIPREKILVPVAFAGSAALAIVILQKKGFWYHFMPMTFLLFFGFLILLSEWQRRKWMVTIAALLFALSFGPVFHPTVWKKMISDRREVMRVLAQLTQPGDSIMLFTSTLTLAYPALPLYGLEPGTRYLEYFPLAFFNNTRERRKLLPMEYPGPNDLMPKERVFVARVQADLLAAKTKWLMFPKPVTIVNTFVPTQFDTFKYFQSSGLFDVVKDKYDLVVDNDKFLVFRYRD